MNITITAIANNISLKLNVLLQSSLYWIEIQALNETHNLNNLMNNLRAIPQLLLIMMLKVKMYEESETAIK